MNRSKSLASKKAAIGIHNEARKPITAKKTTAKIATIPNKSSGFGLEFMPSHTNDLDDYLAKEHAKDEAQKEREAKVKMAEKRK